MATKPLVEIEWATQSTTAGPSGNPNRQEPTQPFKDFGQPEAGPIDRQSLNYHLNAVQQWIEWSEQSIDEIQGTQQNVDPWITLNSNTTLVSGNKYVVNTSGSSVDVTLPSPLIANNPIIIYHPTSRTSENSCRVVNNGHTLNGKNLSLTSVDNLILDEGYVSEIIPVSETTAFLRVTKVN